MKTKLGPYFEVSAYTTVDLGCLGTSKKCYCTCRVADVSTSNERIDRLLTKELPKPEAFNEAPSGTIENQSKVRPTDPICSDRCNLGSEAGSVTKLNLAGCFHGLLSYSSEGEGKGWVAKMQSDQSEEDVRDGSLGHGEDLVLVPPNARAEATREACRPWPAAENEPATPLPAKGGMPRGVASRASTCTREPKVEQLIESRAVAVSGHAGLATPAGIRNHLSRTVQKPCFWHFATDIAGRRLVTDSGRSDQGGRVFTASLGKAGEEALSEWTCLALPRSSWKKEAHIHPFLSPDGTLAFFNSDESGILQAYMIRGAASGSH